VSVNVSQFQSNAIKITFKVINFDR